MTKFGVKKGSKKGQKWHFLGKKPKKTLKNGFFWPFFTDFLKHHGLTSVKNLWEKQDKTSKKIILKKSTFKKGRFFAKKRHF